MPADPVMTAIAKMTGEIRKQAQIDLIDGALVDMRAAALAATDERVAFAVEFAATYLRQLMARVGGVPRDGFGDKELDRIANVDREPAALPAATEQDHGGGRAGDTAPARGR